MPLIVLLTSLLALLPSPIAFINPADEKEAGIKSNSIAQNLGSEAEGQMAYSDLRQALESNQLRQVVFFSTGQAELLFRDDSRAKVTFPPDRLSALADVPRGATVRIANEPESSGSSLQGFWRVGLPILLLAGFFIGLFYFLNRSEGANTPRVKKKDRDEEAPASRNTFSDVAGYDEVIEELKEFVQFLASPERFHALGARIPSGAILWGPPGTGKTLLARALAGEAGVPFFYMAGSEAINKYVGVGASNIRSLFTKARRSSEGAVIFIDEIDAMGKQRSGADAGGGDREYDQTLNQLLVELDGFRPDEKIIVLAATNRLDTLDPALLRPGRLTRHIPVLLPQEGARLEILELHSRGKPLAKDVNLASLAKVTAGSSGATLAEVINEAAIMAARSGDKEITEKHLQDGHLRAIAGPESKEGNLNAKEQKQIAIHEAGHVLAAELCSEHEKAQRVTIRSRGMAGGLALYGQEDRVLHSPEYIHQQLICLLAGRAAEKVLLGAVSSGAANDLQRATELARRSIEEWGLSPLTGQIVTRGQDAVSDATRSVVDSEVERSVAEAFSEAARMLEKNKKSLQDLSDALLEKETLEREDIVTLLGNISPDSAPPSRQGPDLKPALPARHTERSAPAARRRKQSRLPELLSAFWHQFRNRKRERVTS